jgi:pyruvate dehydrogenase E1 component beta subunit
MSTWADRGSPATVAGLQLSYREAISAALEDEMIRDPAVLLIGEDVATAGGVFKTNEGLVEKFGPDRIRNTPICENTFLGLALGMAVTGMRPVVEIMFSDFLPTAGDAIVNELPKFRFMSGGQCAVPITVRAIGGATGRFGTQHSATGESWYLQLPGLKVAAASSPASAYGLLRAAIQDDNPVLFFEHKGLYGRKGTIVRGEAGIARIGKADVARTGTDITIVATLLMADRALQAAERLAKDGIDAEVIDLCWLRPLDIQTVARSVQHTGRLIVVEEQVHVAGWGATVISELTMRGIVWKARPRAVSMPDDLLVPYSPPLEDRIVPTSDMIAEAAVRVLS